MKNAILLLIFFLFVPTETYAWNCPQAKPGYPYSRESTYLKEYGEVPQGQLVLEDSEGRQFEVEHPKEIDHQKLEKGQLKIKSYTGEDSTLLIQRAIKCAYDYSIKKVILDPKIYILNAKSSQNAIVFYGKNITFEGNGSLFVKDSPSGGYFGDPFDVYGLIQGSRYPEVTGDLKEAQQFTFHGESRPAENITLRNFSIYHLKQVKYMNSIGIVNAKNVTISNVRSYYSPQTAFAAVTVNVGPTQYVASVENLRIENTASLFAGYHAYRVSQQSRQSRLQVEIENSRSVGVRNVESYEPEVNGHRLHLWYRPIVHSRQVSLEVTNSSFDESARIATSVKSSGMTLKSNQILGGITLRGAGPFLIENNEMVCGPKLDASKSTSGLIQKNEFIADEKGSKLEDCMILGEDTKEIGNSIRLAKFNK